MALDRTPPFPRANHSTAHPDLDFQSTLGFRFRMLSVGKAASVLAAVELLYGTMMVVTGTWAAEMAAGTPTQMTVKELRQRWIEMGNQLASSVHLGLVQPLAVLPWGGRVPDRTDRMDKSAGEQRKKRGSGDETCRQFSRGNCSYGASCKFRHVAGNGGADAGERGTDKKKKSA